MQIENTAVNTSAVDTNKEYIIPQNAATEPAVLGTVLKRSLLKLSKISLGASLVSFFVI